MQERAHGVQWKFVCKLPLDPGLAGSLSDANTTELGNDWTKSRRRFSGASLLTNLTSRTLSASHNLRCWIHKSPLNARLFSVLLMWLKKEHPSSSPATSCAWISVAQILLTFPSSISQVSRDRTICRGCIMSSLKHTKDSFRMRNRKMSSLLKIWSSVRSRAIAWY